MPILVKIMLFVYILTLFIWFVLLLCSFCYVVCEGDDEAQLGWHNAARSLAGLLAKLIIVDVASFIPMAFWFMSLR